MTMTTSSTSTTSVRKSGSRLGYRFNLVGVIGLAVILSWALVAVFAPLIIPYPVGEIVDLDYFGPMSHDFWLGSDYLGRDMLSRILMGARYTVGISLAAVTIACWEARSASAASRARRRSPARTRRRSSRSNGAIWSDSESSMSLCSASVPSEARSA